MLFGALLNVHRRRSISIVQKKSTFPSNFFPSQDFRWPNHDKAEFRGKPRSATTTSCTSRRDEVEKTKGTPDSSEVS